MPRRYLDGFDAPPDDRGSGAVFIVILGIAVAALALGSGWLSVQALMDRRPAEVVSTTTTAVAAVPAAPVTPASPAALPSPTAGARKPAAPDWDIANGHFFTQTNSDEPLSSSIGFAVTNERGVPFWEEFRRLGGVEAVGYPISRRFEWRGAETQVFQRAILQWNQGAYQVQMVNILDELHDQGKDELLLQKYLTPQPLPALFDAGKPFDVVVGSRLALLDPDPVIRSFYNSASDPMALYGLPSSSITDMGSNWAIRLQRGVLQRWKVDQPWARAGSVTAANAGELAVKAGMLPLEPLQPEMGQ